MAKPIKITPVLRGKDAIVFLNKVNDIKHSTSSKSKLKAIREDSNALKSIFKK
ncbi:MULTISPECIES: hypothetical protein [Myroides]|uniref:hypothetical protein n=1 Tax=Myroides TaxID=76831 RepID=UPI0018EEECD0|nr:hypothetical protein [Myroides phaeus]